MTKKNEILIYLCQAELSKLKRAFVVYQKDSLAEMARSRKNLSKAEEDKTHLEKQIESCRNESASLKNQITRLEVELRAMTDKHSSAQDQLGLVRQKLFFAAKSHSSQLVASQERSNAKIKQLEEEILELKASQDHFASIKASLEKIFRQDSLFCRTPTNDADELAEMNDSQLCDLVLML